MGDTKNTKTLVITDPPQYGVVTDDINSSIFRDVYKDALHSVAEIVDSNESLKKNNSSENKRIFTTEELSTTIAFVGKRGSGKSTVMCNFAGMLNEGKYTVFWEKVDEETLGSKRFHVLPTIDSSHLGDKETVIGRISAAMYEQYRENNQRQSAEAKRTICRKMHDVDNYAVKYKTGEWFKSNDELLEDTYHISILRKEVQELVAYYLNFIEEREIRGKNTDSYLVICIDDLDMGIENSYPIMEELRKFLSIPSVIVLVTLRMDQIHLSLKSAFSRQLNYKDADKEDRNVVNDLAYRYAEKLFPYSRRHEMPEIRLNELENWKAKFKRYTDKEYGELPINIKNATLDLVWRKTRILLVCNSERTHLLIPGNLRSFCHFIAFLRGMNAIEKEKKDKDDDSMSFLEHDVKNTDSERLSVNIRLFSKYLKDNVYSFEYDDIGDEDFRLAERLISIIDGLDNISLSRINSYIVGEILYYLEQNKNSYYSHFFELIELRKDRNGNVGKTGEDYIEKTNELKLLLESCNEPETITSGDLMYVLGEIDDKTNCYYLRYLIEVLRTLWSARVTEAYYKYGKENREYKLAIGIMIVNPDIFSFGDNTNTEKGEDLTIIDYIEATEMPCRRYVGIHCGDEKNHINPFVAKRFVRYGIPSFSMDLNYSLFEVVHKQGALYLLDDLIAYIEKIGKIEKNELYYAIQTRECLNRINVEPKWKKEFRNLRRQLRDLVDDKSSIMVDTVHRISWELHNYACFVCDNLPNVDRSVFSGLERIYFEEIGNYNKIIDASSESGEIQERYRNDEIAIVKEIIRAIGTILNDTDS